MIELKLIESDGSYVLFIEIDHGEVIGMSKKILVSFTPDVPVGQFRLRPADFFGFFDDNEAALTFASESPQFIGADQKQFFVLDADVFMRSRVDGELAETEKKAANPNNHFRGDSGVMRCRCHEQTSGDVDVLHDVNGQDMPHVEKSYFCRWTEKKPSRNGRILSVQEALSMSVR